MTVRIYEPFDYLIKKRRNSAENRLNYALLFWVTFSQNGTAGF